MDFGQQRMQQQQNAKSMMYQNPGYQFERRNQKTLILDIADNDGGSEPLGKAEEFSVELFEPLIIDKLSDIYLDSFMTHNSSLCASANTMAFSLQINEFNVNSNVASSDGGQNTFNRIIIPNDHSSIEDVHSCVVHKGKKLNYVCSINPSTLSTISGTITNLLGTSIFGHGVGLSGVIYYVSLDDPVTTHIPKETVFGFDGGVSVVTTTTTGFKTIFEMQEGSTDLYFQAGIIDAVVGATFVDVATRETGSTGGSGGAAGLNSLTVNTSTYRKGDYPRFIAEFVIVARE